jgi:hypothetical protein
MTTPLYQYLNIPSLNEEYSNKIKKLGNERADYLRSNPGILTNVDDVGVAYDREQFLQLFDGTNIVMQEYVFFDDNTTAYLESLFEGFTNPTFALNLIFNMQGPDKPAVAPVHNDSYRANWVANYVIDAGGDVKTSFFESNNTINNRTDENSGFYWSSEEYHEDPILDMKYETDRWYWFDTFKPHRVSDVATTRVLLTMSSVDSVQELLDRYGV